MIYGKNYVKYCAVAFRNITYCPLLNIICYYKLFFIHFSLAIFHCPLFNNNDCKNDLLWGILSAPGSLGPLEQHTSAVILSLFTLPPNTLLKRMAKVILWLLSNDFIIWLLPKSNFFFCFGTCGWLWLTLAD